MTSLFQRLLYVGAVIVIVIVVITRSQDVFEGLGEYCQWETFEAKCSQDEVIVITNAYYGRMQRGRCIVTSDHVGCMSNVRKLADLHCSGRQSCQISVPDKLFDSAADQPCRSDLKVYLLAGYTCVKVLRARASGECRNPKDGSASESGRLASIITSTTGCGSVDTPWLITVGPGQTINITVIDYGSAASGVVEASRNATGGVRGGDGGGRGRNGSSYTCRVYAVIKDLGSARTSTMCGDALGQVSWVSRGGSGGGGEREAATEPYQSDSSSIEIRLPGVKTGTTDAGQFLLHYEAIGCIDMTSSSQVTWTRRGSNATLVCADGRVIQVTCRARTWFPAGRSDGTLDGSGATLNCSDEDVAILGQSLVLKVFPLSHVGAMIVILLIAIIVGLIIFIGGVYVIRRKRAERLMTSRTVGGMAGGGAGGGSGGGLTCPQHGKLQSIYGRQRDDTYQCSTVKWSTTSHPGDHRYPSAGNIAPLPYSLPSRNDSLAYESGGNEYAYVDELQLPPAQEYPPEPRRGRNAYGLLSQGVSRGTVLREGQIEEEEGDEGIDEGEEGFGQDKMGHVMGHGRTQYYKIQLGGHHNCNSGSSHRDAHARII